MFSPQFTENARFKMKTNVFSTRNSYQSANFSTINNGSTRLQIKSSFEPIKKNLSSCVTPKINLNKFSTSQNDGNRYERHVGKNVGKSIDIKSAWINKTLLRHSVNTANTLDTRRSIAMPKLAQFSGGV